MIFIFFLGNMKNLPFNTKERFLSIIISSIWIVCKYLVSEHFPFQRALTYLPKRWSLIFISHKHWRFVMYIVLTKRECDWLRVKIAREGKYSFYSWGAGTPSFQRVIYLYPWVYFSLNTARGIYKHGSCYNFYLLHFFPLCCYGWRRRWQRYIVV